MVLSLASMETLKSMFPIFHTNPVFLSTKPLKSLKVSIKPPPPDFDFRSEILEYSRATIAKTHPELLDLAVNGSLVLVEKRLFGPVPSWRTEFVEPEAIWLVGTTHISQESAMDVERVVRAVNPDNVVVELCRSRAGIMYSFDENGEQTQQQLRSNMFSLSGTGFFGAVGRSLNLGGQTALALRLLLSVFSSKISSDVNRPFGDEFRAARKVSEEVDAQIVLGDRPIEITLERAWKSLTWNEKLSLVSSVVRGIISSSDKFQNHVKINCIADAFIELGSIEILVMTYDEVKSISRFSRNVWLMLYMKCICRAPDRALTIELDSDDSKFQLYEQLSLSYPSLLQPLIHERDTYLAWSLKRSKAVNGCTKVVGVIGNGHMNGVIYALVSDQGNLRFRDLVGRSPGDVSNPWIARLFNSLVRDTVIGILLWALYEQVKGAS